MEAKVQFGEPMTKLRKKWLSHIVFAPLQTHAEKKQKKHKNVFKLRLGHNSRAGFSVKGRQGGIDITKLAWTSLSSTAALSKNEPLPKAASA